MPSPYHHVVSLDKNLYTTLSRSTQVYKWVPAILLGVTLRWTSILSGGRLVPNSRQPAAGRINQLLGLFLLATFVIYMFFKTSYLFLYWCRYMKIKLISHCSLLT